MPCGTTPRVQRATHATNLADADTRMGLSARHECGKLVAWPKPNKKWVATGKLGIEGWPARCQTQLAALALLPHVYAVHLWDACCHVSAASEGQARLAEAPLEAQQPTSPLCIRSVGVLFTVQSTQSPAALHILSLRQLGSCIRSHLGVFVVEVVLQHLAPYRDALINVYRLHITHQEQQRQEWGVAQATNTGQRLR
jgi:hypothetical protein